MSRLQPLIDELGADLVEEYAWYLPFSWEEAEGLLNELLKETVRLKKVPSAELKEQSHESPVSEPPALEPSVSEPPISEPSAPEPAIPKREKLNDEVDDAEEMAYLRSYEEGRLPKRSTARPQRTEVFTPLFDLEDDEGGGLSLFGEEDF